MRRFRVFPGILVGLSVGLTGCYYSTRSVQKTQAPDVYHSASVETLQQQLSDRDDAIKTLTAQVLVTFSTGGGKEGKVVTYTSFKGYITVQKPRNLRVIMLLPVVGSQAGIMVSNGEDFTLLIPPKNKAYTGTNAVTKPSANALENLRPSVFFDSLLVPGSGPNEYISLTESTRILPPQRHKPAIEEPDYDLTLSRVTKGNILHTTRVVHINRIDMLPFQQDVYDEHGQIVTTSTYEAYQDFNGIKFPTILNINRPLNELSLKVQIVKLTFNEKLDDDTFDLPIPPGYTVQKLE